MKIKDQIDYALRFYRWADTQPCKDDGDANSIRTLSKYLASDAWKKEIIDSYIDGRLSLLENIEES